MTYNNIIKNIKYFINIYKSIIKYIWNVFIKFVIFVINKIIQLY